MGRRGRHEGTIIQRSDGRWEAKLTIAGSGGRRLRKSFYGKTRAAVAERLTRALRDQQQGLPVRADERQATGAFLEGWLATIRPTVRPTTFVSYEGHVRRHLRPALERVPLAKLTPQHVRELLAAKLEAGLSPRTVQYVQAVLRAALNQALRDGLVARNVAMLVSGPRVRRHEIQPLGPEEARRLLDAARGDRLEALYTVATMLGLRQGEALGLRWSDVDLEAGTLRVTRTLQRIPKMLRGDDDRGRGTRYVLAEPKTSGSRRTVVMPRTVAAALTAHRIRQIEERLAAGPAWQPSWDLVFATSIGTPLDARNVTKGFQALVSRAGLPRLRFHDLRHSAATLLLAQGIPPRVIMETLGHSQISMTMNLYAHVLPTLQREAADRMDELFAVGAE